MAHSCAVQRVVQPKQWLKFNLKSFNPLIRKHAYIRGLMYANCIDEEISIDFQGCVGVQRQDLTI